MEIKGQAPKNGQEQILANIAHVQQILTTTRTSRFYFAGRERTRRQWMTWIYCERKRLDY